MLKPRPISPAAYRRYGEVLRLGAGGRAANQGTASRRDWAAELKNLRPRARPNLSLFRCAPRRRPFAASLLERHPHSTQVFLPLSQPARYLALVALGGARPDMRTLRAFLVEGPVGISYRPGVWHHPMAALGRVTDFACLVWEDGGSGDCEMFELPAPLPVSF